MLTILVSLLAASQVGAQQALVHSITLPHQPLQEALTTIGKQFEQTIVVSADLVRGKMAPATSGTFTVDQAIAKVLVGTDLVTHRGLDGGIVITTRSTTTDEQDSTSAAPKEHSERGLRLPTVLVTGERFARSLHETASSAVVISGQDIANSASTKEVDDILESIPNVDLGGNSNEGPTIRGIKAGGPLSGVHAFFGGSRPRASTTVDGRTLNASEFIFGTTSLWDVERVEVFRGPQTTSQGVNSIAGAIHVLTANPTFEPEIKAQVEKGNHGRTRLSAAISGPVVKDELALRLAGDVQQRDTFINMITTENYGPNPEEFFSWTVRGKALWKPTALPKLKMKLTLSTSRAESPQAEYVKRPISDWQAISTNMPSRRVDTITGIHDVRYAFSDSLELSNRFSYANVLTKRYVTPAGNAQVRKETDEVANELNLHWNSKANGLSGLIGVFYQQSDSDEKLDYSRRATIGKGNFDDEQSNLGLYTELTYDITPKLDLTVGVRYERDSQDRTGKLDGTFGINVDYQKTFSAFLPKVSLGYDVTEDWRIGALVSRGFNPGGMTVLWSDGKKCFFDEETVWNYEVFSRLKLLDNRLVFNGNAFYAQYSDYQLMKLHGFFGGVHPVYEIANADKATSYGLELSAEYLPIEKLRLTAGAGLLHTRIDKYEDNGGIDIEGAEFMRSPDVTLSFGADYEVIEGLTLGGRARYVGKYMSEDTNTAISAGNYAVFDAQASYEFKSFTLYGYMNNVFNEKYVVSELSIGRAIVGKPREFGIGIRYNF